MVFVENITYTFWEIFLGADRKEVVGFRNMGRWYRVLEVLVYWISIVRGLSYFFYRRGDGGWR